MDTPYWVDVPRPDWRAHLSESALEPDGDWGTLERLFTRFHSRRLDLSRPLWEACLVHHLDGLEGLPPRCQAVILKFHHAAIDGMSLAAIIDAMHRGDRTAPATPAGALRPPEYWDMWARVNLNAMSRQFRFVETMRQAVPRFLRVARGPRASSDLPPVSSNRTRFNDQVSSGRATGSLFWPKADIVAIRHAVRRVTLNDIALSLVGGALRLYLSAHGQLPEGSLACGVPISLRGAASSPEGNQIATMRVGLATQLEAPIERLRLVHRYAVAGKREINALGTGTVMDISDSLIPGMLAGGLRVFARASRLADLPVPFHTMISNVPGPGLPLRLGTARLVVPFGYGPLRDDLGLFHVVSSSNRMWSLSFTACSRLMPDAGFYHQCLMRAFADLKRAAGV